MNFSGLIGTQLSLSQKLLMDLKKISLHQKCSAKIALYLLQVKAVSYNFLLIPYSDSSVLKNKLFTAGVQVRTS
jgi:hypothetical protein